jgi:hypothetical protein
VIKLLRAIHTADVRFNECNVFEYDQKSNRFHMINEKEISYPFDAVMNDRDFIVFVTDGREEGSCYRMQNQNVNEYYNE